MNSACVMDGENKMQCIFLIQDKDISPNPVKAWHWKQLLGNSQDDNRKSINDLSMYH